MCPHVYYVYYVHIVFSVLCFSLAMTKPDRQLIAQVMLYSQGFRTAEILASKIVPFFKSVVEDGIIQTQILKHEFNDLHQSLFTDIGST